MCEGEGGLDGVCVRGEGGLDIIFIKSCALPVPSLRNYRTSCMYNNYYGKYSEFRHG